jgi:hypothetical protein
MHQMCRSSCKLDTYERAMPSGTYFDYSWSNTETNGAVRLTTATLALIATLTSRLAFDLS